MFEKTAQYARNPRGEKELYIKVYSVPEELERTDLVSLAEHAPCAFPWVEVSFFYDCRRTPERWSFAELYAREEQLADVERIGFPIVAHAAKLVVEGDITGISHSLQLQFQSQEDAAPPALELSDVLGDAAEKLHDLGLGKPDNLAALFRWARFQQEVGAEELDGLSGWVTHKLFLLREGKEPAAALARFLRERPDKRSTLRSGRYGSYYLKDPTYILIGSREDARDFASGESELAEACRRENIHVIGGSLGGFLDFWDSFDQKAYWVRIEEYPGSADDAATYGYVTLFCEDGRRLYG